MIAFVRGEIADITEDNVVLDVGGIGYNIKVSTQTAQRLPGIGKEAMLHTYTCVREDAFQLFGFLTKDELSIFKKLITVNGIGPKGGLAILSVMSADDLRFAIISGDAKAIAKAPGIGSKTASRVILDLKDKVSVEETLIKREMNEYAALGENGNLQAENEAVEALVALGYSPSDAVKAVKKASAPADADAEVILKLALKNMF
ncbi:MAG: Holliday junction branch migration protein RuvA [Lachnospiraceae bacterium]|nr:Holliday junction branch migration protein RuvA [Lachnospiraceae bacterium]